MHEFFLVNHGKSGVLGSFGAQVPLAPRRGDRVLVQSQRGLEVGTVLGPASVRQARLLGSQSSGVLLRQLLPDDASVLHTLHKREQELIAKGTALAEVLAPTLVVLDAELFFDGRHALMQILCASDLDVDALVRRLQNEFDLEIKLENLAAMGEGESGDHPHEGGGCGKPDCGKSEGGCSTCSTGGGCSSCGSGGIEIKNYFAHLREGMASRQRTPLL